MYNEPELSITLIIEVIIGVALLITFFVVAARIGSITRTLKTLLSITMQNPNSQIEVKCEHCNGVYKVMATHQNELIQCPKCQHHNMVPKLPQ